MSTRIPIPPRAACDPMDWIEPLLAADTREGVAAALVDIALQARGCAAASLLWDTGAAAPRLLAGAAPDAAGHRLVERAVATRAHAAAHPCSDADLLALPLQDVPAVLLLRAASPAQLPELHAAIAAPAQAAAPLFARAMRWAELLHANERLAHSEQVQRALFAISDLAGSDRDMDEVLRGIHAIVGTLMNAENFFIVRFDVEQDMLRFLYFVDVEDPQPPDTRLSEREGTLTWYLLHDAKPIRGTADELDAQVSGPLRQVGTDSFDWLGVPMLRDGRVEGGIVLQTYRPGLRYTADDQALLEFVGSHILTALDRKRSTEELESSVRQRTQELAAANLGLQAEIVERQRAERLQRALFEIAQLATADLTEDAFYRSIHQVVGALLNAQNFYIGLLSEDGSAIEFPYYIDNSRRELPTRRPLGNGMSEYVLRNARALLCNTEDILALAERGQIELAVAGPPAVCWLGVPLFIAGNAVGLITVQSYDADTIYGAPELELLGFVASQIANSLNRRRAAQIQQHAFALLEERVAERTHELRNEIAERVRVQEQLRHEVMHDALTGLPNRGYLRERLERVLGILRREPLRKSALLYLDIDRFKVVNDSLGHLAGDAMLQAVAMRLQECVREPDLVARLSGDEFAVLLEQVPVPEAAVRVAQRILELLSEPLLLAGKEVEPSASIGIAITDASYLGADDVLRDADIALYRAKGLGRKRFELFDASLQKHAVDVLEMERDLRVALHDDQFVPYFQPIQCLETREVVGYEALIRWQHPARGLLAPAQFLPIAEDSGSIEAIDWWMFEHSCRLGAQGLGRERYVTLNVSPLHFRREDFGQRLARMLERTGLPPSRLVIEVTEGSLLDDPEGVRDSLAWLRAQGIGAALDDFGTGYSSLSYLHTFPLQSVKIDRSFVSRLGADEGNSDAVVVSILALARALGMDAIAEGIETQAQYDTLLAMGCRFGQGYLLGRPAPITQWQDAVP
jgi:diguanylate cyclase (GGDEF)-like protein